VDERTVEVRVLQDFLLFRFAQGLGILLAVPRLDLPAAGSIPGIDAGHPLQRKLLADH
jgi:hypothetical protein